MRTPHASTVVFSLCLIASLLAVGPAAVRADTLTFRDGESSYTSTHDTELNAASPDEMKGTIRSIRVSGTPRVPGVGSVRRPLRRERRSDSARFDDRRREPQADRERPRRGPSAGHAGPPPDARRLERVLHVELDRWRDRAGRRGVSHDSRRHPGGPRPGIVPALHGARGSVADLVGRRSESGLGRDHGRGEDPVPERKMGRRWRVVVRRFRSSRRSPCVPC